MTPSRGDPPRLTPAPLVRVYGGRLPGAAGWTQPARGAALRVPGLHGTARAELRGGAPRPAQVCASARRAIRSGRAGGVAARRGEAAGGGRIQVGGSRAQTSTGRPRRGASSSSPGCDAARRRVVWGYAAASKLESCVIVRSAWKTPRAPARARPDHLGCIRPQFECQRCLRGNRGKRLSCKVLSKTSEPEAPHPPP